MIRLPLTQQQHDFWLAGRIAGSAPWLGATIALASDVDLRVIRTALEAVVQRHEALRTTFELVHGYPMQRISDSVSVQLPVMELADAGDLANPISAYRLENQPLFRFTVIASAGKPRLLQFGIHHGISDEYSVTIILRDLAQAYSLLIRGTDAKLGRL